MIPIGKRLYEVHTANQRPQFNFFKACAFYVLLVLMGLKIASKILYKHQELQTNKTGKEDVLVCEHSKCDIGHLPQTMEK